MGCVCQDGPSAMSPPRPNLFLIGAMKSGTTYLSELLGAHPAIFMCTPKEPCHFVKQSQLRKVWAEGWKRGYGRDLDRYLSLFAGAGATPVIAEASTFYSQAPLFAGVPERIRAFNPQARLVYVMRDPIERTISQYWHHVRWWGERRPMLRALQSEPHYRDVSHYARQLSVYLRRFERERIYVLTCEALAADSAGELSRLYGWLGVDPTFRPATLGTPNNVLPQVIEQARGYGLLHRFRRSELYRHVAPFITNRVRTRFARIATREVRPAEFDTSAVQRYLRPEQQRQSEELSRLLGRRFPEWRTLYAHEVSHPEASYALNPTR